jgi:hypothetical protein
VPGFRFDLWLRVSHRRRKGVDRDIITAFAARGANLLLADILRAALHQSHGIAICTRWDVTLPNDSHRLFWGDGRGVVEL